MKEKGKSQMDAAGLKIRIQIKGGASECFVQHDPAIVARMVEGLQPARVFVASKITIAGEFSLTTFVTSQIIRLDFISGALPLWDFPPGILDVVELSEAQFRSRAHLDDPARLEKRERPKEPGECTVVFLDVEMAGGERIFLAVEILVSLPAERLQRLHLLFSSHALHCRLLQGGIAVLNLSNLARFTIYPGPDHTPADAWPAHHAIVH